ncbi:MAG: helix-turn-helix transcriptional regulator [Bacteroidota bacterium]
MVNSDEFSDRLKKVMEYYNLTASAFADRIQVQRSSISHLLSGRNKPSLDFVMKVIDEFNEVELYWLLIGKGSFPKTATSPLPQKQNIPDQPKRTLTDKPIKFETASENSRKDIERIVIFYTDGTFTEYQK